MLFLLLFLSVDLHTRGILGEQLRPSWGSNLLALVFPFLFHPSSQTHPNFCSYPVAGRAVCLGVMFSSRPTEGQLCFGGTLPWVSPGFFLHPKSSSLQRKISHLQLSIPLWLTSIWPTRSPWVGWLVLSVLLLSQIFMLAASGKSLKEANQGSGTS